MIELSEITNEKERARIEKDRARALRHYYKHREKKLAYQAERRKALTPEQKAEIVGDLYPKNPKGAQQILDKYLSEDANAYNGNVSVDSTSPVGGMAETIRKVKGGYRLEIGRAHV